MPWRDCCQDVSYHPFNASIVSCKLQLGIPAANDCEWLGVRCLRDDVEYGQFRLRKAGELSASYEEYGLVSGLSYKHVMLFGG